MMISVTLFWPYNEGVFYCMVAIAETCVVCDELASAG